MSEPIDKSLTFQEYLNKVKELQRSEGEIIRERFEHLGLTFDIFNENRKELIASIEYFKSPESLLLFDIRNNDQMEIFLKEIIRRLHNFLASALTFVEHTRIRVNEIYKNTDFYEEYKIQKNNALG